MPNSDYAGQSKDEMLIASRLISDRSILDRPNALYFDAVSASVARDLPAATNSYLEIAKLKPNDAVSYLDLGHAYENHDELDKAIEQYAKAAALDATNPAPPLRLAVLQGRRQDLSRAGEGLTSQRASTKKTRILKAAPKFLTSEVTCFANEQDTRGPKELPTSRLTSQPPPITNTSRSEPCFCWVRSPIHRARPTRRKLRHSRTGSGPFERAWKIWLRRGCLILAILLLLKRSFAEAESYVSSGPHSGADLSGKTQRSSREPIAGINLHAAGTSR